MNYQFYKAKCHETKYTEYGGEIYPSDFNTEYRSKACKGGSAVASRIIYDRMFDIQCKRNIEIRQMQANFTSDKERD